MVGVTERCVSSIRFSEVPEHHAGLGRSDISTSSARPASKWQQRVLSASPSPEPATSSASSAPPKHSERLRGPGGGQERSGIARSQMTDHDVPNRSRNMLNRRAKNVSSSGMNISPPSASSAWMRSASSGLSTER